MLLHRRLEEAKVKQQKEEAKPVEEQQEETVKSVEEQQEETVKSVEEQQEETVKPARLRKSVKKEE